MTGSHMHEVRRWIGAIVYFCGTAGAAACIIAWGLLGVFAGFATFAIGTAISVLVDVERWKGLPSRETVAWEARHPWTREG